MTWAFWVGGFVAAAVGLFLILEIARPRYVGFMILGTSHRDLLWHETTWRRIRPLVDEILEKHRIKASVLWFQDRQNRPTETDWDTPAAACWTYRGDAVGSGSDRTEFSEAFIYSPPRRKLVSNRQSVPTLFLKIARHDPYEFESNSLCTQYCLLFARHSLFRRHKARVIELVAAISEASVAARIGHLKVRIGRLNDFESGDLDPYYEDGHLDEVPDFEKMRLPWVPFTPP